MHAGRGGPLETLAYRRGDDSDGRPKPWWVEVDHAAVNSELAFPASRNYDWDAEPIVQRLTAAERYKAAC